MDEHAESRLRGFARTALVFWLLLEDVEVCEDDRL